VIGDIRPTCLSLFLCQGHNIFAEIVAGAERTHGASRKFFGGQLSF
jgi:hypothetical protein